MQPVPCSTNPLSYPNIRTATARNHTLAITRRTASGVHSAVVRVFVAVVASYLALSLALGVAQQSYLWLRGQHATPQQWSAHERFDHLGQPDHHRHVGGQSGPAPLERLFETDASTAPAAAPLMPLDGTACALGAPLLTVGAACPGASLGTLQALAPPIPPLSPPRLPPRLG